MSAWTTTAGVTAKENVSTRWAAEYAATVHLDMWMTAALGAQVDEC